MKLWRNDNSRRNIYLLTYLLNYSSVLRPSQIFDFLNFGSPFFPFYCVLSSSLHPHLLQILPHFFQPSRYLFSVSTISLQFNLKCFLTHFLIHSCYMSNPFKSLLFNICYNVYIFVYLPQFLISSRAPYPCSTTGPCIPLNIFLSHVPSFPYASLSQPTFHSHPLQLVSQSF